MKRILSIMLILHLLIAILPAGYAEQSCQNAIIELYSVDGYYEDVVGNRETYSYHVPQINDDTPAAEEINAEIAKDFGERVEAQFKNMEGGYSLWSWHTEWEAYWNGPQVFLLIIADENSDRTKYGAYGFDFEAGSRVTNDTILEQKGISGAQYLEKLSEATTVLFEELYKPIPEGVETNLSHDSLLGDTLSWLSLDQPMFLNRFGEIETWVSIATPAGAGRYDHLVTLFPDSDDKSYNISLVGDTHLVESCPETAKAGETVTILTYDVTDGVKKISVDGVDGVSIDWFKYQFVMPDHDVKVRVKFISSWQA